MKSKHKFLMLGLIILIAAVNFSVDRITKIYAVENIRGQGTIKVVGRVFILHYAENDGAFLGMGGEMPEPLKTVMLILLPTVIVALAIVYTAFSGNIPISQLVCLSCIIGGGAGNLYDRIFNNGIVIDFMNFGIGNLRTGILNVADLSVTFGAIVFILLQLGAHDGSRTVSSRDSAGEA